MLPYHARRTHPSRIRSFGSTLQPRYVFGATILDPPAEYADYGEGYYAVFFADPDGLKLEYVFTPPSAEVRVAP